MGLIWSGMVGSQTGEVIILTRDWANFQTPKFWRQASIKQYHHFRFDQSSLGVVHLKTHSGAVEDERVILKDRQWKPKAIVLAESHSLLMRTPQLA